MRFFEMPEDTNHFCVIPCIQEVLWMLGALDAKLHIHIVKNLIYKQAASPIFRVNLQAVLTTFSPNKTTRATGNDLKREIAIQICRMCPPSGRSSQAYQEALAVLQETEILG